MENWPKTRSILFFLQIHRQKKREWEDSLQVSNKWIRIEIWDINLHTLLYFYPGIYII